MQEIKLGDVIARQGENPVRICGKSSDGYFLARQQLTPLDERILLKNFSADMLVAGAILRLPSGRTVQLISRNGTGSWENESDKLMELSAKNIERMRADSHAANLRAAEYSHAAAEFRASMQPGKTDARVKYRPR